MSKIDDVSKKFDHWMKHYDHHADSHSESLKEFIASDSCITTCGVSYAEYVALALKAKDMGYKIEWVVPQETFDLLLAQFRTRIAER